MSIKKLVKIALPIIDIVLVLPVYPAALLMKLIRQAGVGRMPFCRKALKQIGMFPIRNHYYEPLFDTRLLRYPLDRDRSLPGIDMNTEEQISLLASFKFNNEFHWINTEYINDLTFNINNRTFKSGDAEFFYNLIRLKKPARLFEIGSGNSTLVARRAIERNKAENSEYKCNHLCIEPYEMPWLEKCGATIVRARVEDVSTEVFCELAAGDILFIDSSHMIRPQGDVLFEILEILPSLNIGVIVHFHDIFTPRDYLNKWLAEKVLFWNEQYILEAFLTCNPEWKIIGALNFLQHHHFEQLQEKCQFLTRDREPVSFYIQKIT